MEKQRIRLSTIDLLPPEADLDVTWACTEIEAQSRLLIDIHAEFNARLADRGIGPISASAFSRYALNKRRAFAALKETRDISVAIAGSLRPGENDALTVAVAQFAKTVAFRLLRDGKTDSRGLMEITKAIQSIESATRTSSAHRDQTEKRAADKATKDAVQTIERVASEAGVSKERIAQMRRDFLGVRPKAKKAEPDT